MLLLFETPAGFALFKLLDKKKLYQVEDLHKEFSTPESARTIVKFKAFYKFENMAEALSETKSLIDGEASESLVNFLTANFKGDRLGVTDYHLAYDITDKLQIKCVYNTPVLELMRGLRSQVAELVSGLYTTDLVPMSLGLSHSLSRYKLKFSPDKVDMMIIQAIGLLDDLDVELNTYSMRVREWYGWHFPELSKIIQDNIVYAKIVNFLGDRVNAANLDFSQLLPEETEAELKEASMISMGTEVSSLDLDNMKDLCNQVISLSEYRVRLYDYLKSRMTMIAPNLTALVGELVGARLIAHGGSLRNLAKKPGSTIQILGAEKALFRALKTKQETPKYGLIYHASLVSHAAPKHKGNISRSLAAKAALAARCDALGDGEDNSMGLDNRDKLEARLRNLKVRELVHSAGSVKRKPVIEFYDKDKEGSHMRRCSRGMEHPAKTLNPDADSVIGLTEVSTKTTEENAEIQEAGDEIPLTEEKECKDKKKAVAEKTASLYDKDRKGSRMRRCSRVMVTPAKIEAAAEELPATAEKRSKTKKKVGAEETAQPDENEKKERRIKKQKDDNIDADAAKNNKKRKHVEVGEKTNKPQAKREKKSKI